MKNDSILLVEDNASNVKLLQVLLEAEHYLIRTAGSAEEATSILKTFEPRLILMDIQLPDIDGLELTRRIKSDPARRHIPVLALTAYAMKGDKEKALAAGCDDYITKPIDTRSFPKLIARYLEGGNGSSGKPSAPV